MSKKLMIVDGGGAAWRARYVYWGTTMQSSRKVAHLGVDPTASRPNIFGSFMGKEFRVSLPVLRFSHPMNSLRLRVYKAQQRVLCGLDGRYGWGTKRAA